MTLLDLKKQERGLPLYSIPSSVQSNCDNTKTYHFWMSAYMARSLVIDHGIPSDVAAQSVYIAEKGYQINRDMSSGRYGPPGSSPTISIGLSQSPFSPTHQIIRTDLAYAAAGAVYGSHPDQQTHENVDNALLALMKDASVTTPAPSYLQDTQWGKYETFVHLFSPDSAINHVSSDDR